MEDWVNHPHLHLYRLEVLGEGQVLDLRQVKWGRMETIQEMEASGRLLLLEVAAAEVEHLLLLRPRHSLVATADMERAVVGVAEYMDQAQVMAVEAVVVVVAI